ncbi:hypothetical protein LCGC14_2221010 [marine sediment metagenome]|uniref:Uncharacterized protein n=1 Tax=marine sediment metagenome TaxID=412755 RepID=A0A0F9G6K1_9ZZZZ
MINAIVLFIAVLLGSLIGYLLFLINKHGFKIPEIKIFKWKFFGKQIVENPEIRIKKVLNDPELLYKKLTEGGNKYLNHGREFEVKLVENKETGKKEVQIEEGTMRKTLKPKESLESGVEPGSPLKIKSKKKVKKLKGKKK